MRSVWSWDHVVDALPDLVVTVAAHPTASLEELLELGWGIEYQRAHPSDKRTAGIQAGAWDETLEETYGTSDLRCGATSGSRSVSYSPATFHVRPSLTSVSVLRLLLPSWMLLTVAVAVEPLTSIDWTDTSSWSTWSS
jgi:hypothetical protein